MKIEVASQETIKFNQIITEMFVSEVFDLAIEEFLITDESRVEDFRSNKAERGKKLTSGEYEFIETRINSKKAQKETGKMFWEIPEAQRKTYEEKVTYTAAVEEVSHRKDIVKKVKEVFGVRLKVSDLEGYLWEVAQKISKTISPEKRKEIEKNYRELIRGN